MADLAVKTIVQEWLRAIAGSKATRAGSAPKEKRRPRPIAMVKRGIK